MIGVVGLNNIKANDYFNVVIQAWPCLVSVCHVRQAIVQVGPFRDFFLDERHYAGCSDPLIVACAHM